MWVQVFGFALLCLTAAFLAWPIWKAALRQRRRERWPRVTGKVLEQRMREDHNSIYLEYLVSYEYGGETWQRVCRDSRGGRYTPKPRLSFRQSMKRMLELFPVQGDIELMLNPDDPGTAYYRRGWRWPLFTIAVVATLAFLALIATLTPVIFQAP
jgi:hypothetical protein